MTTKYHKTFGQVEIVKEDANSTTIVVIATGEEKKLLKKFADILISDEPFVKATKKKVVKEAPAYTEQDEINIAIYQDKEWRKTMREVSLTPAQRAENARYRQAGSSLR